MLIAAILLAAGDASIDGVPLALLPWDDGETLIEYNVAQLQAAGVDVVVVVLGYDSERIIPLVALDDVEPIVNARWQAGQAGSLRSGATAVPRDTEAAIIVRIDEPREAGVYRRLLDAHARSGAAITRPAFEGTPGTPIIIGRPVLAEVRNVTDAAGGLDGILARHAGEIVDAAFSDDAVLVRIEDAASYARVRERLGYATGSGNSR